MYEQILVVDDEKDVVQFASKALNRLGYHAVGVFSSAEALALLKEQPFDLLLTDVMMPGMNGLELLQEARAIYPNLTAVVITGFSTFELTLKALRAGARDFLPKPFSMTDLRQAVENALAQSRLVKEHNQLRALLPLFELTKQTLLGTDATALVERLVDVAMSETGADGVGLMLAGAANGHDHLSFVAQRGELPIPFDGCGELAESMRGADQSRTLSVQDTLPPGLDSAMREHDLATMLCCPLRTPNQFVGVLGLTRKQGRLPFQQTDIELTSVLGSLAAALIENTRLVLQLNTWNRELEVRVDERTRELKDAQASLLRAERLGTIGQLGASVAHELRNPLGVINNSIYYLTSRLGQDDPKIAKHLQIIGREVKVANNIITDLMNFVRISELQTTTIDPNLLVRETLERALLPENVQVFTEFGRDLPLVRVDVEKAHQIFLNLINNAAQAMPDGGRLTISTLAQNGYVQFDFGDTGVGIPPENLQRIFEPLFTTKARGIGLGLAIVRMLVDAHHGEIRVTSTVGQGSCFTIRLPNDKGEQRA
jgi:signal transduction histidine kinase/CheY-like chemotaxis protein